MVVLKIGGLIYYSLITSCQMMDLQIAWDGVGIWLMICLWAYYKKKLVGWIVLLSLIVG
jgi:hypothetical protein